MSICFRSCLRKAEKKKRLKWNENGLLHRNGLYSTLNICQRRELCHLLHWSDFWKNFRTFSGFSRSLWNDEHFFFFCWKRSPFFGVFLCIFNRLHAYSKILQVYCLMKIWLHLKTNQLKKICGNIGPWLFIWKNQKLFFTRKIGRRLTADVEIKFVMGLLCNY